MALEVPCPHVYARFSTQPTRQQRRAQRTSSGTTATRGAPRPRRPPSRPATRTEATASQVDPDERRLAALADTISQQTRDVRAHLDALTTALDRVEARLEDKGKAALAPARREPAALRSHGGACPRRPGPRTAQPAAPLAATGDRSAGLRSAARGAAPPSGPPRDPPATPARTGTAGSSETTRLVAVEMAVGGATRAEVGERLREQFGISDPTSLLDSVFGAGSAGDTRVPWS